jgi:hypothetical protein
MSCAFDNPLCTSLYEGCACDCDCDMEGTVLDQYQMRAKRAERLLLAMVRAVRQGKVTEEMLETAQRVSMQHQD